MSAAVVLRQLAGPWIFRSGRPFGQGGDAVSLALPWPTTLAGALRTARGDREGLDFSDPAQRAQLLEYAVAGPLLASAKEDGVVEAFYPRPADAVYLQAAQGGAPSLFRCVPGGPPAGSGCDLPPGLQPVFLEGDRRGKPADGPSWWTGAALEAWLSGRRPAGSVDALGTPGPVLGRRTHVRIDPATQAAEEARLFQTEGAVYGGCKAAPAGQELGLLARVAHRIEGMVRLGADGGMAWAQWHAEGWPTVPEALAQALGTASRIRLIVVTPAVFAGGWRPGWLQETNGRWEGAPPGLPGLRLRLAAAALGRWEAVSGWDLAQRRPRAIRRAVPPGAVYWFEVLAGSEQVPRLWLHSIADAASIRRDGFGLVVPGLWTEGD